jgi:hypothetical protein
MQRELKKKESNIITRNDAAAATVATASELNTAQTGPGGGLNCIFVLACTDWQYQSIQSREYKIKTSIEKKRKQSHGGAADGR